MSNDEKLKWEGNGATPVEMITLTEAALHYVRAKQQARAEVIEDIQKLIEFEFKNLPLEYFDIETFKEIILTKLSEAK